MGIEKYTEDGVIVTVEGRDIITYVVRTKAGHQVLEGHSEGKVLVPYGGNLEVIRDNGMVDMVNAPDEVLVSDRVKLAASRRFPGIKLGV